MDQIYYAENKEKQKLVVPLEETYNQKLQRWMEQPYVTKGFKDDEFYIMSNRGIKVRSKSEKIFADYFEHVGLSYKYECPLMLQGYGIIYPDFTFLSHRTGHEVYWEHEGMLDNPEYAKSAVKKINLYKKNGIFPGENLILTFESSATVLSTEIMRKLTEKYL